MLNVIQDPSELTRRGFVTNYPLFRQWRKDAVDEGLRQKPLNVYLHIPYCVQRCAYCHYKTITLRDTQLSEIDRYVNSLRRETVLATERFHLRERPTISIYFGGGTPGLLNAENIDRLMTELRENLTLADPEITFEAEPVSLTRPKAEILASHGVNRISIGIQSFCDDIVFRTGRRDTEKRALESIDTALATGAAVNIDLLSGLAGETLETWAYSIRRAIETGVHSITVYKLEIYANTDYFDELRRHTITLPSDNEELGLARYALDELRDAGYHPVSFFMFTREPKYAQRHTTTKWKGVDNYALGVSSFGCLGNWAYQNTNDLDRYSDLVASGALPIVRGYRYNALELMTRDVLLQMKLVRFDRAAFKSQYGVDLGRLCPAAVERLQEDSFITVSDDAIVMTDKGILYGDYVGRMLALELESLAN